MTNRKYINYLGYYESGDHTYPITNILGVENPDAFRCEVTGFRQTHTRLTVHCSARDESNTTKAFRLDFETISYFELLSTWEGINISVASPDDCANLMKQVAFGVHPVPKEVLELNTLFVIDSTHRKLRIISTGLTAYPLANKEEYFASLRR